MNKRASLPVVASLVLLAWSCAFQPSDVYRNKDLQEPGPLEVTVSLGDLTSPYYLTQVIKVPVQIDVEGNRIYKTKVITDGIDEQRGQSNSFDYYLSPTDFIDGEHRIVFYWEVKSNSGSMADLIGAEYYVVQKEILFNVNRNAPPPPTGLNMKMVDGKLTLGWEPVMARNFTYTITVENEVDGNVQTDEWEIKDPGVTSATYAPFVGGKVHFSVDCRSAFFSAKTSSDPFELIPFEATLSVNEKNEVQATWNMLYDFGSDAVVELGSKDPKLYPASKGAGTADEILFGEDAIANMTLYRQNEDKALGYTITDTLKVAPNFKKFHYFKFLHAQNKLITMKTWFFDDNESDKRTKIYRYNSITMELEDSVVLDETEQAQMTISEDGNHAYLYYSSSTTSSEPSLTPFDPMDLSSFSPAIDISAITPAADSYENFSLSNDNQLLYNTSEGSSIRKVVLTDLNTMTMKWSKDNSTNSSMSHDGKYIAAFVDQTEFLYSNGDDVVELGTVVFGSGFFTISGPRRLIISSYLKSFIYDLESTPVNGAFTALKSADLEIHSYDPITNTLVNEEWDENGVSSLSLYDGSNFSFIRDVKAVSPSWGHFYGNGYQMVRTGFYRKLE